MKVNGSLITQLRKQMGYKTPQELAKVVGCNPKYLRRIELNRQEPSERLVKKIAAVLGVKPNYFIADEDIVPATEIILTPIAEAALKNLIDTHGARLVIGPEEFDIPKDLALTFAKMIFLYQEG